MYQVTKTLCLLFLISVNTSCAFANCVYNDKLFSEKNYADNKEISTYHWFSESNEVKGVLKNGNLFSVKHWSCNHYGIHAVMVLGPEIKEIPDSLNDQIQLLAIIALSHSERALLFKQMGNQSINIPETSFKLTVTSKEFDEFYLQITVVGEAIFIEIKLYKG